MKKLHIGQLAQVFILLTIFTGWCFAQSGDLSTTPKPKATPRATPKVECEDCPSAPDVKTPKNPIAPPARISNKSKTEAVAPPEHSIGGVRVENDQDVPFEKSIEVDEKVSIDLCISEGTVRINGWGRDEIRVFVKDGTKAGFRTRGKNEDGKPTTVTILGYDPLKDKGKNLSSCLSGDEIELDIPSGAVIRELKGYEGEVFLSVESISKARILVNQGEVKLRGIEDGIYARVLDGDISVEDCYGSVDLSATNGNILVYNVDPIEDSDSLKAKTNNGILVLQSVSHSWVEVATISGLIKYTGEIQPDGQYTFKNSTGQIILGIPNDTSCTFTVFSHKDKFKSELNYKTLTVDTTSTIRKLVGQFGEGEATITLQSESGLITIKKQN